MNFTGKINKIGLGTVQFGTSYGISNANGQTSKEEVSAILAFAQKKGIHYIDTASVYGSAELVLGENDLSSFRVISKFMPATNEASVIQQFNDSLAKLKVKKLYGYLAQRPTDIFNNPGHWKQLEGLKKKGLIQKVGFSFNTIMEIEQILSLNIQPDLIQVPFNLFDSRFVKFMKILKKKGSEIHTRSTFLQGLFFTDVEKLPPFFDSVKPIISRMQAKFGNRLSGALLNYVVDANFVDVVIIGVETRQQLITNLKELGNSIETGISTPKIDPKILIPSQWPTKTN